ncbi:hypothetical protein PSHT_13389 [Puccinia striiformis]|uniref:RING-type domain-containing protein n=1 Tax=Puccinia striiformis TaxID=27350 RepID=A0A2S4UR85_9BASI|nr:hypothetical protein PSHT_13389 [Puccinia striiformis]
MTIDTNSSFANPRHTSATSFIKHESSRSCLPEPIHAAAEHGDFLGILMGGNPSSHIQCFVQYHRPKPTFCRGRFAPSSPSSDDGLWPPSDRPWTSSSSFSQSTDTGNSQLDADHLHQYNIDQILNSLGNALSAFSLSLHQTISTCGMCLEDYQSDDLVLVLPCHSSHFFHRHCLRSSEGE